MGSDTKILSLSIYRRKCNFKNFDGGHFDNGGPTYSPFQFGDGGIQFSYSYKFREQNKIGLIRSWGKGCT